MKDRHRKLAREKFWSEHEKDHYQCPDCGRLASQIKQQFHVHHKNGNAHDNKQENLVALCPPCHKLREGKRVTVDEAKRLRMAAGGADQLTTQQLYGLLRVFSSSSRSPSKKEWWEFISGDTGAVYSSDNFDVDSRDEILNIEPSNKTELLYYLAGMINEAESVQEKIQEMASLAPPSNCFVCGDDSDTAHQFYSTGLLRDERMKAVVNGELLCPSCYEKWTEADGMAKTKFE